jgi:hypothetical protein
MSDDNKERKRHHGGGGGDGGDSNPDAEAEETQEQKIRRLEGELAQIRKQREELAQIRKEREEIRKEREEMGALRDGKYYASFHQVWKKSWLSYQKVGYETKLMRQKVPSVKLPSSIHTEMELDKVYMKTMVEASKSDTVVKDDGQSARTSHSGIEIRETIWPCDVLENNQEPQKDQNDQESKTEMASRIADVDFDVDSNVGEREKNLLSDLKKMKGHDNFVTPDASTQVLSDLKSNNDLPTKRSSRVVGEIAHLVPACPLHASLYYNVAKCVFALDNDVSEEAVQKLIHGCHMENKEEKSRISGVGLKHFASNKLRLSKARDFFQQHANILIVPILTIQQVCEWNGDGYEALFMIGRKEGDAPIDAIAQTTRFQEKGPTADETEIECARVLLTDALQFLMQSLWEELPQCLSEKHKELLNIYRDSVVSTDGTKQVVFPEQRNDGEKRPVRKIRFGPQTGGRTPSGGCNIVHPAPDPLLLVVKAAINWSKAHEQQLLAGGEYDSDDDISTLSGIAEQMYYEACQEERRKAMDNDVSGMTIGI